MAFTVGEYQDVFLEEADEQLQELNQNLLQLEKDNDNHESINNIFRAAHSLKSSAAFVGLNDLSDLAHNMENLLQGIRDKTMDVTPEIIDILFQCFDVINTVINSVSSGEEPNEDLTGIMKKIEEISKRTRSGRRHTNGKVKEETEAVAKTTLAVGDRRKISEGIKAGKSCCEVEVYIEKSAPMRWVKVQLILNNLEQNADIIKTIPGENELSEKWSDESLRIILITELSTIDIIKACEIDQVMRVDMKNVSLIKRNNKLGLKFSEKETLFREEAEWPDTVENNKNNERTAELTIDRSEEKFLENVDDIIKDDDTKRDDIKSTILKSIKVSVDKLDILLNNVGELVIANSGFFKLFEEIKVTDIEKSVVNEFKNRMDQMSRIAKDLQGGIMKTRMVPIGQIFSRFNRLVRDLAKDFDKNVKLEIKGEDTELDKKVIDAIGEPLIHLIRNAIDHGIETAEERKRLGKLEEATITLNAYQGGNQIIVEVSDDGRGLNTEKIKEEAVEKGLVTVEMLSNMDDDDVFNFIFQPGFSTAEIITDISGRGVGMNVVNETISELSGAIRIDTEPGMGTKFELTFPLTLAIIPAIMVKVSHEMYAIPLADVIETVKISYNDVTTIESREVVNLRGEILSLLRLNHFVGLESDLKEETDKIPVVVVGFGNRKIGIVVDYLEGKQEIVIKSLEENYCSIEGLSGASILGDGNICLILDIASMINKVITDEDRSFKQRIVERMTIDDDLKKETSIIPEVMEEEGERIVEKRNNFISFDESEDEPVSTDKLADFPAEGSVPDSGLQADEEVHEDKEIKTTERADEPGIHTDKLDTSEIKEDVIFDKTEEENKNITIFSDDKDEKIDQDTPVTKIKEGTGTDEEAISLEEERPEETSIEKKDTLLIEPDDEKDDEQEMAEKVKETLKEFRQELEDNIKAVDEQDDYIMNSMGIEEGDIDKISVVMNVGITNAAESLSKIIDKEISISIPDVKIIPIKMIPETLGEIDTVYIGVYMNVLGDIKGSILFSLSENSGYQLIDMLYGSADDQTKKLDEDGESALKEVTNIVGSSVLNTISDKVKMMIRPDVPTIIHDYIQSTIDSILVINNITDEYALFMDTLFYYQDNSILGKMIILTETDSLKRMIENLRNV